MIKRSICALAAGALFIGACGGDSVGGDNSIGADDATIDEALDDLSDDLPDAEEAQEAAENLVDDITDDLEAIQESEGGSRSDVDRQRPDLGIPERALRVR